MGIVKHLGRDRAQQEFSEWTVSSGRHHDKGVWTIAGEANNLACRIAFRECSQVTCVPENSCSMKQSNPIRADVRSRSLLMRADRGAASGDPNQVGGGSTTVDHMHHHNLRTEALAIAFTAGTTARLSAEKSTGDRIRLKVIIADLLSKCLR
jgi:hypothetical protein